MPEPTLFISHKTTDSNIAQVVGGFVEQNTGGRVSVFLSSDANFQGPKIGKGLSAQLRKALWDLTCSF